MYTYVDIGNSSIKVKRPDGQTFVYSTDDFNIDSILDTCGHHEFVFASVVPKVLNKIISSPNLSNKKYRVIDTRSNLSFSHDLEGVGIDRLLVVEGVLTISFPPFVVIDAGTAITLDIVISKNGNAYLAGGIIIPGFSLGLKSLSD